MNKQAWIGFAVAAAAAAGMYLLWPKPEAVTPAPEVVNVVPITKPPAPSPSVGEGPSANQPKPSVPVEPKVVEAKPVVPVEPKVVEVKPVTKPVVKPKPKKPVVKKHKCCCKKKVK